MPQKAPGKAFRKGLTLAKLFRLFPDDNAAQNWFSEARWGDTPACPYCGSLNVQTPIKHKSQTHRCREYKVCGKRFSVKTETVMAHSNIGCQGWLIAIYLLLTSLKGVSSMKLHRDLGISQKSAWHLAHRIRKTFEAADDSHWSLPGPVEVDESHFGGLEKNKHAADKLNAGRGTVGKTAVVGVKDRRTNTVRATVIPDLKKDTLLGFVDKHVSWGTKVYSDEAAAYEDILDHEAVRHGIGEYVRGPVHIQGIESFWSMLKRAHKGTYHKFSPKHLDRYVREFSGRHNMREADTLEQMALVAHGLLNKQLRYQDLIEPTRFASGARA